LRSGNPWTLRSGWAQCRDEAAIILKPDSVPGLKDVIKLLNETNAEIAKLVLDPTPEQVPLPPRFKDTQIVAWASWALVLALSVGTVLYGVRHQPKIPQIRWDWIARIVSSPEEPPIVEKNTVKPSAEVTSAGGAKNVLETLAELRLAKREAKEKDEPVVRMSWPFKTPLEARILNVLQRPVASSAQLAVAEEMAQLVVDHYDPKTINAIIAVQVPVEKDVGLMLYDGRTGKITDKKVYTTGFVPFAKSWLEIDAKKVIYLDRP